MSEASSRQTDEVLRQLALVQDKMRAGREALERHLPALSVDGESPDGAVRLAVNADGVLTSLRLTEAVRRMSPAEIANTVLRTYAEAQRTAARQAAELLLPLGHNGYLQDRMAWRQEFQPEPQAEAPSPSRRGGHVEDDGDQVNWQTEW